MTNEKDNNSQKANIELNRKFNENEQKSYMEDKTSTEAANQKMDQAFYPDDQKQESHSPDFFYNQQTALYKTENAREKEEDSSDDD
ncbi:hypothetical protein [Pseudalkalibacillus caeni]|uniref:DUF4025 domain-containing protein n=1 Tax=Exobacillus caeni TaxID=2574798 RepID=A0A5R9F650_9BACL|nr:hypothetical protein [Pseudalkalibacillus caeni]TLS36303.1 hypothetical protein FCL54_15335 [Pseudalkalibacillus caeni]